MKIRDILPIDWCKVCDDAYNMNNVIYPYAEHTYPHMCQDCIENRIKLEREHERITS